MLLTVIYLVLVEILYITVIPVFPYADIGVKRFRYGSKSPLFQLFKDVHALLPYLLNTRSKAYLVASIR